MDTNKIVLASNNEHKIKEFRQMFKKFEILSLEDVGFYNEIVEDGQTFLENAYIKAEAVRLFLKEKGINSIIIADDSGLCVEALGGRPGVYSARYAGDHDYKKSIQKLIEEMKDKKDKTAYFLCMIVMMDMEGNYQSFEGRTYGKILGEKHGDKGFGFDPIFFSDDLKKSFGEASSEEKNSVSHRGRAIEELKKVLSKSIFGRKIKIGDKTWLGNTKL